MIARSPWLVCLVSIALSCVACDAPSTDTSVEPEASREIAAEAPPIAPDTPAVATAPRRAVSLVFSGDLVLNPRTMRHLSATPGAFDAALAAWAVRVREDDVAYVNLEMPLVDDVEELDSGAPLGDRARPRHAPVLGGTSAVADAIARAGIDIVGVANNHAFDQGHTGLARTLEALDARDIAHVGATPAERDPLTPIVLERGGLRIAYLAATEALNQRHRAEPEGRMRVALLRDEAQLAQALADARTRADLVVLALHWGRDFAGQPTAAQRALARRLVEAGADLVVGTGPHVLHPVERLTSSRGDALIFYSLGNFISGMGHAYRIGHEVPPSRHPANSQPEARDVALLRVHARVDDTVHLAQVEAELFWTLNEQASAERGGEHGVTALIALSEADEAVRREREPIARAALGPQVHYPDAPPAL